MPLTHIFVTAGEGRTVPVPANDATAPGGTLLLCQPPEKDKPAKIYRLPYSGYTRKRIAIGDLFPCNVYGTKVANLEDAAASPDPELYEVDETGAVTGLAKKPTPEKAPPAPTKAKE